MSNDELKDLAPVSSECITAIKKQKLEIMNAVMDEVKMKMRIEGRDDKDSVGKVEEGLSMVIDILLPIMEFGDRALLEDQLRWGDNRLPEEGFSKEFVFDNFRKLQTAFKNTLEYDDYRQTVPFFRMILEF